MVNKRDIVLDYSNISRLTSYQSCFNQSLLLKGRRTGRWPKAGITCEGRVNGGGIVLGRNANKTTFLTE